MDASEFNFRVIEVFFNYLLVNNLFEDEDFYGNYEETPEEAAQKFINVIERLMGLHKNSVQIPTTIEQAKLMHLLAEKFLKQNNITNEG